MDIQPLLHPQLTTNPVCYPPLSYDNISIIAIVTSVLGVLWTAYNLMMLRRIDLEAENDIEGEEGLIEDMPEKQRTLIQEFGYKVYDAALQYLKLQYLLCFVLILVAFMLLWFLTELQIEAAISFLVGAFISVFAGVGCLILATRASPRVAYCSKFGIGSTFRTAYQASSAIGFGLASLNLLALTVTIEIYKEQLGLGNISPEKEYFRKLFEAVAGYGLGASLVALVTRLGGGMFEGATEAGSELIGRVEGALPLNHSRNAATVALHAGHNIEGIVAANSDLVGSYSELACVAFLLSSTSLVGWIAQQDISCGVNLGSLVLPLLVLSLGLLASLGASVVGVLFVWIQTVEELGRTLRLQRLISSILMAGLFFLCTYLCLPQSFKLEGVQMLVNTIHSGWQAYLCGLVGILAYVVLCVFSELVASRKLPFVVSLADKCRKGPAAAVTLGLAFGYIASFAPAIIISLVTFYGYQFLGFYGIALSILGFISTFPIQIALQCLAPIASDAATSSRIASLGDEEKEVTAHLSRAGESTAIVSRGAMIGSSPLIGIILFGGFLRNASLDSESAETGISLTDPQIFTGLMIGGVLPFILSGLAVKGSRKAISPLVKEIQCQLRQDQGIAREESEVDYASSVGPASISVVKHLIAPILIVAILPLLLGFALSPELIAGMLPGLIVSGLQFASSSNLSGEAWQSTRKHIEDGEVADEDGRVHGIGSTAHKAATIGNLVGVVMKKNGSSSISASLKLIGMVAILFGSKFAEIHA